MAGPARPLSTRFPKRPAVALGAVAALVAVLAADEPARASLAPMVPDEVAPERSLRATGLVRRIQKALADLGLYLGRQDSRLNSATRGAITVYQRSVGLEPDGKASRKLYEHLAYTLGVRRLLRRLDQVRREGKSKAREKLLNHPVTRDLLAEPEAIETADPTRDPRPCFRSPRVRCLLDEARESAKAIHKAELRDWALGEILVAEARAGLGERAMSTAARIRDPCLIMVALRDIAEAQAAGGAPEEALAAAEIIPDAAKQAEALAAIAAIQQRRGDAADARATVARLMIVLEEIDDPVKRVQLSTRGAVILAGADDRPGADAALAAAEAEARALDGSPRETALRHVVAAFADLQETARALDLLADVDGDTDRVPVLMSAAEAQARAGDAAAALATAESIDAIRYRAVVLGRIAVVQAEADDVAVAATTLEMALAAVERIKRPYARSYAVSRLALAMTRVRDRAAGPPPGTATFAKAVATARRIDDARLRAHTLWLIAARQHRADDAGAMATEAAAQQATDEIKGDLSRVWMFAEIAGGLAEAGRQTDAWSAYGRGLVTAEGIGNAWARSRALAKLAATLYRLVSPGRGRAPDLE